MVNQLQLPTSYINSSVDFSPLSKIGESMQADRRNKEAGELIKDIYLKQQQGSGVAPPPLAAIPQQPGMPAQPGVNPMAPRPVATQGAMMPPGMIPGSSPILPSGGFTGPVMTPPGMTPPPTAQPNLPPPSPWHPSTWRAPPLSDVLGAVMKGPSGFW
jgi:hypothetical protein